jgi:hypothetical protein
MIDHGEVGVEQREPAEPVTDIRDLRGEKAGEFRAQEIDPPQAKAMRTCRKILGSILSNSMSSETLTRLSSSRPMMACPRPLTILNNGPFSDLKPLAKYTDCGNLCN